MIKLLLLLKKIHYPLLFLILESISIYFYVNSNIYTRAAAMEVTTGVTAFAHERISNVGGYFSLQKVNDDLMNENARLKELLLEAQSRDSLKNALRPDSTWQLSGIRAVEKILVSPVIKNTYTKQNNFIILGRGTKDGMQPNMALFNSDGIVGYTLRCSQNFTIALSLLNVQDFSVGGRLKNTDFTGAILWDGLTYDKVIIEELPKYANIKVGDTIVTACSTIFPDDMPIGTIKSFEIASGTFYRAEIKLFADMSRLRYVYATQMKDQQELLKLEMTETIGAEDAERDTIKKYVPVQVN